MVPQEIIEQYLPESPSASLLQGEWEKHGACAFDDAKRILTNNVNCIAP